MRAFYALGFTLALASCATLSKEECLSGNWEEIGFRDGTNGRTSAHIQKHAKACSDSGVQPQSTPWEKGRQRGLPVYCVPAKAYSEGKSGRSLSPVCPASQMPSLSAANERGRKYYALSGEISSARAEISEIESELVVAESPSLRALLVQKIRTLNARISLLETQRRAYDTL